MRAHDDEIARDGMRSANDLLGRRAFFQEAMDIDTRPFIVIQFLPVLRQILLGMFVEDQFPLVSLKRRRNVQNVEWRMIILCQATCEPKGVVGEVRKISGMKDAADGQHGITPRDGTASCRNARSRATESS